MQSDVATWDEFSGRLEAVVIATQPHCGLSGRHLQQHHEVGLRADRPIVLYLCSSEFVAPNEVGFVRGWIDRLRAMNLNQTILPRVSCGRCGG